MIKIISRKKIKEGRVEDFLVLARELVKKSSVEEGNVYYTLNADREDPRTFCYIEAWRDQAAVDAHNRSGHFLRIVPLTRALCESSTLEIYEEVEV